MLSPTKALVIAALVIAAVTFAKRSEPLLAQPYSPCQCTLVTNTFIWDDACVGTASESVTCTANVNGTCSMSGTLTWNPYNPTCAVNSSVSGIYEPPYWPSYGSFNLSQSLSQAVSDTQSCNANPGPAMYAKMQGLYYTYTGSCSCTANTTFFTAEKRWTCDQI
jgi:hypothetical protein